MEKTLAWYKAALKNALLMEDFEEATQLRQIIRVIKARA